MQINLTRIVEILDFDKEEDLWLTCTTFFCQETGKIKYACLFDRMVWATNTKEGVSERICGKDLDINNAIKKFCYKLSGQLIEYNRYPDMELRTIIFPILIHTKDKEVNELLEKAKLEQ